MRSECDIPMKAVLELITYTRTRPATNGLGEHPSVPDHVSAVGWVVGGDCQTIMLAASLTEDGPRGTTHIRRDSIESRTRLVGLIPAEQFTVEICRSANAQ